MNTSIQHTVVVSKQWATASPVTTPGILSVAATDSRPDRFLNVESGNLTQAAINRRPGRCESFESDECNSEIHCAMLDENMDGGTEHTGDFISRDFVDIGNGADVIEVDCDGDKVKNGEFVVEPAANNMVDSNVDSRPQLAKGMRFVNATSGLHHVQAYAMANKKQVKIFRRSGIDSRITCTSEGCPFFVQF
ncbi:hypothetical protein PR003_g1538 [Phytophthora rubi]|uniref:Uncharacterized protein n=1 Tax=Phytophthora rubi TaxID=129364 RepID=A0A6A4FVF0_9STRA|nr:hypothetical protein PR002_g7018 [Phytophthora rubi]KAE9357949.1 hypothetical protein PR003_g1538 [Phytophthora rubi]